MSPLEKCHYTGKSDTESFRFLTGLQMAAPSLFPCPGFPQLSGSRRLPAKLQNEREGPGYTDGLQYGRRDGVIVLAGSVDMLSYLIHPRKTMHTSTIRENTSCCVLRTKS